MLTVPLDVFEGRSFFHILYINIPGFLLIGVMYWLWRVWVGGKIIERGLIRAVRLSRKRDPKKRFRG